VVIFAPGEMGLGEIDEMTGVVADVIFTVAAAINYRTILSIVVYVSGV
jgi:hypothetical protein